MGDRGLKPNGTRARGGTLSCCEYRRDSAATFTGSTFACGGLASAGPCQQIFVVVGGVDLSASFVSVGATASRSWLPDLQERSRRHSSLASTCVTCVYVRFERVSLLRARSEDSLRVQALLSLR